MSLCVVEGGITDAVALDLGLVGGTGVRGDKDEFIVVGVDGEFTVGCEGHGNGSLSIVEGEGIDEITVEVAEEDGFGVLADDSIALCIVVDNRTDG